MSARHELAQIKRGADQCGPLARVAPVNPLFAADDQLSEDKSLAGSIASEVPPALVDTSELRNTIKQLKGGGSNG
jgi:hypothetical protein